MAVASNGTVVVAHPTGSERNALGRAARRRVPRSQQALFEPAPDRADPIELLQRQSQTRITELVPIRYGRMVVSPFNFYRGAAAIMAADLATTPRSGMTVQCGGDAHLSNFGVFASPERRLVFDINDFDETLPGPWEWDLKRLCASALIAAQGNGFPVAQQERAVLATVRGYRKAMLGFAAMKNLDVWYARLDAEEVLAQLGSQMDIKAPKGGDEESSAADSRERMAEFSKLTHQVEGHTRIVAHPPLLVPIDDLASGSERDEMFDGLHQILSSYRATLQNDRRALLEQFQLTDLARKVVGVGSVGTRAWVALLLGADGQDPLFLQLKEAQASVLEPFLGPSGFANHGERVVTGQLLMQASSDIFLGWLHVQSGIDGQQRDFYARQLNDWKGAAEIAQMTPKGMARYGAMCGWTLARAHARSGDRIAIAAYLGHGRAFDRAILAFSEAYAEQNQRDFQALLEAVRDGRITAQTGV